MMILGLYLRHRMIGPSSRKGSAGIFGLTATILSPHFDYYNNLLSRFTSVLNASCLRVIKMQQNKLHL